MLLQIPRRSYLFPLLALALSVSPAAVHAYRLQALYEATVSVSAPEKERAAGFAAALEQVLARLTADSDIAYRPGVSPLLRAAEKYVQSYRYLSPDPEQGVGSRFWVRFQEEELNRALREAGVPSWGEARPLTLVWMAADAGAGRKILGLEDAASAPLQELQRQAERLGLPLLHPLLDLEDQRNLDEAALWAGFGETVRAASLRYPADAVLTVRLERWQQESAWQGRWTLYLEAEEVSWVTRGRQATEAAAAGVARLADTLADRFGHLGQRGGKAKVLDVSVGGIKDFARYLQVLNYLESLHEIERVEMAGVRLDRVNLRLTSRLPEQDVRESILLGGLLAPDEAVGAWGYRLRPPVAP